MANKIRSIKNQNKSFEEDQILKWIRQATDALKYLHSRKPEPIIIVYLQLQCITCAAKMSCLGIHRDIKPL